VPSFHSTRRSFLRQLGGAAVAPAILPLLPTAAAAGTGFPQRLLVVCHGQGTLVDELLLSDGPGPLELGPILAPLERHRERLLVVQDVDDATNSLDAPYNAHTRCRLHALTAQGMQWAASGDGVAPSSAGGPSIDQYVASRWAGRTPLRSLELGVKVSSLTGAQWLWRGVGQPVTPEADPDVALARLFGDFMGTDPAEVQRRRVRRDLVLDAVQRQFDRVTPSLASEDRQRLLVHQQAIEEVRASLAGAALGDACQVPDLDLGAGSHDDVSAAHARLLAMAFACDLTRVGTLAFGDINAFPWLDVDLPAGWHDAVHAGPDAAPGARQTLITTFAWFSAQLARVLDALDAVPEGSGTLLDNTLVLFANTFSDGSTHSHEGKTYVLAGGAPGLRMDRVVDAVGAPHGELLTSVLNAIGIHDDAFGDRDFCDRALPGVWS